MTQTFLEHLQASSAANRWMAIGRSSSPDPHTAGRLAAGDAMAEADAKLVVVFASESYDLEALLAGIRSVTGETPLIGCSTAGEISTAGPGECGVVVAALGGSGFSAATGSAVAQDAALREASTRASACMEELDKSHPHQLLLLLTDGLGGDQQEVVRGAFATVGADVPLVGGCAGDDLKMKQTFQLHDGKVLRGAVVAAALGSDAPMGIGVSHGWRKVGQPVLVTASSSNRVFTLDDEPALDVYFRRLNVPEEARSDEAAFTKFAMTHPLGLNRRSGEEVRYIADANFEDRSIGCIAEVPQGGTAWFMEGDDASVLRATDAACEQALEALDGRPALGVLAFDCIARRGVLGDEGIQREVSRIGAMTNGAPVAGFYTYGEIARTRGLNGFHNQTLVVLALA